MELEILKKSDRRLPQDRQVMYAFTDSNRGLTDKSNGMYEFAVSGIAKAGEVTVAVAKTGCTITPASKKVMVNYYVAPVAVGNFCYSDKTYSATYDNAKTCIGGVFRVDPTDANKGKIVSLNETNKAWSIAELSSDAASDTDGTENTAKVFAFESYNASRLPCLWVVCQ